MANKTKPKSQESEKRTNPRVAASDLLWAGKRLFRAAPWDTGMLVLSNILISVTPILNSYIFARLIDEIITYSKIGEPSFRFIFENSYIFHLIAILAVLGAFSQLLKNYFDYVSDRVYNYHLAIQSTLLTQKISSIDVQQFDDKEIYDQIKLAKSNIWKMRNAVRSGVQFITWSVTLIVTGSLAFSLSPILALAAVVASIPQVIVYSKYTRKFWQLIESNNEKERRVGWFEWFLTDDDNMPEQKVAGSNNFLYKLYVKGQKELIESERSLARQQLKESNLATLLDIVTDTFVPIYLIYLTIQKVISIGKFSFYLSQVSNFNGKLIDVAYKATELLDHSRGIHYIRKIFEIEPVIVPGNQQVKTNDKLTVEFKHVWFKYPKAKKFSLKDVNLTIKPGDEIAFVGENGAGKTTLIKLLLRFYDPTKGEILINGTPLKKLSLESYYKQFATLFQDFNTYGALDPSTNIGIGFPNQKFNQSMITQAAQKADAHKFIVKLNNKYKQVLSNAFSNGTRISPGQWQKLALARMFYRDVPMLILDEPTSAIDAVSEYKIFKRVFNFIKGKTVIIISHRFSTVRNAQKIYVIDDGKIAEQGSHEELMKLNGRYAEAFKLQAEGYQANGKIIMKSGKATQAAAASADNNAIIEA